MVWLTCIGQSSGLWVGCERTSPQRGALSHSVCHSLAPAHALTVSLLTIHFVVRPSHYPVVTVKYSKTGRPGNKATDNEPFSPFSFQHPNLVQLMGYCSTPPALIFPFMERLSLYHCLHAYKVNSFVAFNYMLVLMCVSFLFVLITLLL